MLGIETQTHKSQCGTCGHCLSSVVCSTPLAWLVCLTFDFCLPGISEGRPLFLWAWAAAVGLEFGVEVSELGGVDGAFDSKIPEQICKQICLNILTYLYVDLVNIVL